MQKAQEVAEKPTYLLSGEVMELARISRRTLDRWLADGKIRSTKVGGTHRFLRADVEALLSGERAS